MENRKDVTVPMPKEMADEIDGELEYGDSRAGWIRDAIRQRLEREQNAKGNADAATAD
jgi:metal-responsive CopG/Arc/MetJ family transcriptional regulator